MEKPFLPAKGCKLCFQCSEPWCVIKHYLKLSPVAKVTLILEGEVFLLIACNSLLVFSKFICDTWYFLLSEDTSCANTLSILATKVAWDEVV